MAVGRLLALSCALSSSLGVFAQADIDVASRPKGDPCAAIAGKTWVTPKQLRACFESFKVDPVEKANIIEVVNKTLAFHTSTNYQIRAPAPFTSDVHEDVIGSLARISHTRYANDFELHKDLSFTLKRLNDGHCVYINRCYDSLFVTYLPTPLILLTDARGAQAVHIAPEAFKVASDEFKDEIKFWQDALPGPLKGKLESLSGAKVLAINGRDPWDAVNANAAIAGSYQSLATRQNSFFSSYNAGASGWTYSLGQFATSALPLADSVTLTLQLTSGPRVTVTLPYRSRIGTTATAWTDSASFRANNCKAKLTTNGEDLYGNTGARRAPAAPAAEAFRQAPPVPVSAHEHKELLDVVLDTLPLQNIALPAELTPTGGQPASTGPIQFFMLEDGKTGVLALGTFSFSSSLAMERALLAGLQDLKAKGATQLVVDISGNGGGYVCVAHFLHRLIVGPKPSSVPQAGLNSTARAGPLAHLITQKIAAGGDPDQFLLYNAINWRYINDTQIPEGNDWLTPDVPKVINGRRDAFSQPISDGCQPFQIDTPNEPLFDGKNVVIVGNGRCASSCSLFSITMAKLEGAKTVVVGGKKGVPQEYCGIVGGQSSDFSTMDTEIKSVGLKNHTLAPPDFLTNSVQGITWRLGFGIDNPKEPEEWQRHPATLNLPLTIDLVNNPRAIWEKVAKTVF